VSRHSERSRVLRAFAYLRATSIANAVRLQLRRLRQPKYLVGTVVMVGYLALVLGGSIRDPRSFGVAMTAEWLGLMTGLAALALLVAVAAAWLLPGNRAALAFSEAEVAFLFPAPLSRVALINFSLLRSQLVIALSAFLVAVVLGRGRWLPGNAWQHAVALWLVMATLRLHFLGASFAHERLFQAGWKPWLRRTVATAAVLAVFGAMVAWLAAHVTPPGDDDLASPVALGRWLGLALQQPAIDVVLAPFRWLVAPVFAGGGAAWWASLLPAFALLAAHYLWVVRSHVAFEEASIDFARRRAVRAQAMREGRSPFRTGEATARLAPFALAPRGAVPVAFLWKGLIAAGPAGRPRNAAILLAIVAAILFGLARTPWDGLVQLVGGLALGFGVAMPLMGPLVAQRSLRETLDTLDIYKAAPMRGAQVAFGQLLAPVVLIAGTQWVLLLVAMLAGLAEGHAPWDFSAEGVAVVFGVLLLTPPLSMLMLCLPFAGVLWLPAWASAFSARGGGFEVAGQRMIFGVVFMLAVALALLPAGLVGGGAWLLGNLVDWPVAGLVLGDVLAAAIVAVEAAIALRLLGGRIDRFDLSLE
jgi:ABC-2 type transport system permease protein